MATVTMTITDAPGGGATIVVEGNPPIPMVGENPDVHNLTDAQATAIGAAMAVCEMAGESDWRVLLT